MQKHPMMSGCDDWHANESVSSDCHNICPSTNNARTGEYRMTVSVSAGEDKREEEEDEEKGGVFGRSKVTHTGGRCRVAPRQPTELQSTLETSRLLCRSGLSAQHHQTRASTWGHAPPTSPQGTQRRTGTPQPTGMREHETRESTPPCALPRAVGRTFRMFCCGHSFSEMCVCVCVCVCVFVCVCEARTLIECMRSKWRPRRR
jgi:hypothetical protein